MPVQVAHPGVYIEEIPSSTKTVGGVSTSTAAFVDFFARGPISDADHAHAVQVSSFRDFERTFGGLHTKSEASYAVMQFFNNGGTNAFIVRCDDGKGETATRGIDVTVPYIREFAQDAADAAEAAMNSAHAARIVANASQAFGSLDEKKSPLLKPGAAAARAAQELGALDGSKFKTYQGSAAAYGAIRRAMETIDAAMKQAQGAGATVDSAKDLVRKASSLFQTIDIREYGEGRPEELVASAVNAAKDAADAAAALAVTSDAYPPNTVAAIATSVDAASAAVAAVSDIYYATGQGAAAAKSALPDPADAELTPDAAKAKLHIVLGAVRAALDATRRKDPLTEDERTQITTARVKFNEAREARKNLDSAPADPANDDYKAALTAAVTAAGAAADEAQKAVDLEGIRASFGDVPQDAKSLRDEISAVVADDGALGVVKAKLATPPAPTDSAAITEAIRAADTARSAVDALKGHALKLVPEDAQVEDDWPPVAKAAEVAAKKTLEAVAATREAADAAEAAGKVLAQRILQAEASGGTIAKSTRDVAVEAANLAGGARDAAEIAATDARHAADQVRIGPDGKEVLGSIADKEAAAEAIRKTAEAAEKAAEAADKAADKAMDAHIAAMETGAAGGSEKLIINAISPGVWGTDLKVVVRAGKHYQFDIFIEEKKKRHGKLVTVAAEEYRNLTLQDEEAPNFALSVVNHESALIQIGYRGPVVKGARPEAHVPVGGQVDAASFVSLENGRDGGPPDAKRLKDAMRKGLDNIAPAVFNLLCMPITATYTAAEASDAVSGAISYCEQRRAFMIVDIPPTVRTVDNMKTWMEKYGNALNYCAATYYPRIQVPDPLQNYRPRNVGPSGTMAGIYARTDSRRGIWKAPAGIEAVLDGAEIVTRLTDEDNGQLNPLGVNVLRSFPVYGNICWGARTLAGADQLQSGWKYVNVRRLVSYIEESLYQALKWAVFEGNDEELWREIRQQVGTFLSGLFASGAFAGGSPDKAYFVHCDSSTTTPADIDRGIVNIIVGVAPVKPAEFIIVQIEQIAGQE